MDDNRKWLDSQPSYEAILLSKKEHYGDTEAARQFAAEEYAQQFHEWKLAEPVTGILAKYPAPWGRCNVYPVSFAEHNRYHWVPVHKKADLKVSPQKVVAIIGLPQHKVDRMKPEQGIRYVGVNTIEDVRAIRFDAYRLSTDYLERATDNSLLDAVILRLKPGSPQLNII